MNVKQDKKKIMQAASLVGLMVFIVLQYWLLTTFFDSMV